MGEGGRRPDEGPLITYSNLKSKIIAGYKDDHALSGASELLDFNERGARFPHDQGGTGEGDNL